MEISVIIKNKYGDFKSLPIEIDDESYQQVIELSKKFYISGYEMETKEGFVVIPPEIIKESILIIERL
jgi:hypothetical protein